MLFPLSSALADSWLPAGSDRPRGGQGSCLTPFNARNARTTTPSCIITPVSGCRRKRASLCAKALGISGEELGDHNQVPI